MKVDTVQTSFSSGELGPSLYGRTDVAQYKNACKIVENFLIRPYGSVISTPGTEYINACVTGGSTGFVRLLKFVFSRTDAYVIEMGVGYFRFYTNGAIVVSPGTTPYEVAHTYSEAEIKELQFCQLNDVIWITHVDHPIRRLIRSSSTSWTLSDYDFIGGPFLDDNVDATILMSASATNGTVNLTISPTGSGIFVSSGATLGHHGAYFKIGTMSTDSTTGLDVQGYVKIVRVVNSYTATATVMKILKAATSTSLWAEGAWSSVNGYPSRCAFHQSRLWLARTDQEPNGVWGSKPFIYDDFGVNNGEDGDAIDISIAGAESNDIKWLASAQALMAGTYAGDYSIKAGESAALTPSNTNVTKETGTGSEPIQPRKIGNYLYYVQRFARKLRELFYSFDLDAQKTVDKTILSPHIAGDGFTEIDYQENPEQVLWCVCSNGTLATLTREIDQEVQGWARQTTDGYYESIAVIPSQDGPYDEIWVVVRRSIGGSDVRYIERFYSPIVPESQDLCKYLHSALTYSAYDATLSPTSTSISLSDITSVGTTVVVTASDVYFSSGDVGQRIRAIDADGETVGEIEITGYTSSTIVVGEVVTTFSALTIAAGLWGLSVSEISGLDHLEGEDVNVLADGGLDAPEKTVSNGTITLADDYFVVTAGKSYTQKIVTLPQEAGSQRGTSQGKIQRINQVAFKVNNSYTGFKTGGTEDTVDQVSFRDPSTPMGSAPALYTGVIPNINFRDTYKYGSEIVIINEDPLPIELLSMISSLDTNDK